MAILAPAAPTSFLLRICHHPRKLALSSPASSSQSPSLVTHAVSSKPLTNCTQIQARKSITFHIGETSVTLPFSYEAAKGLSSEISTLLATFKQKENASRLQRWKNMEYEQRGEDGVLTELFCNPNAYSNPFQAKVLITVSDEKIKFTSEAQLIAIKADVNQFLEELS